MYDIALAGEILRQIRRAALTVLRRFEPIESPGDFTASEEVWRNWMQSACN